MTTKSCDKNEKKKAKQRELISELKGQRPRSISKPASPKEKVETRLLDYGKMKE
jgi:hypothetical protein